MKNIEGFAQQVQTMQKRLDQLYQGASASVQLQPDLLPLAFKELGIFSEELQVAVEELKQQNLELAAARYAVERERQRYQELFELAPDGYLVTDAEGVIQEANCIAAQLFNVSQRFLVGKPLSVFMAEEDRQAFYAQLIQLQTSKQVVKEFSLNLCPRQGRPFKAAIAGSSVRDLQGKVIGLRLCIRDLNNAGREFRLSNPAETEVEENDYDPSQNGQKQVYLKGETITLKPQTIWLVCQGIVKLSTMSESGEEVLVGLAGPLMPFGSNLTSLEIYQATALCEVELVCFSFKDLEAYPHIAQKILPQITHRLRQTEAFLALSGQRHVKDRLHYLLLLLKQEIGQSVEQGTRLSVRLTHQELAAACATTRATITRMLGKLQAQGKITFDPKNHIIILNEQKSQRQ